MCTTDYKKRAIMRATSSTWESSGMLYNLAREAEADLGQLIHGSQSRVIGYNFEPFLAIGELECRASGGVVRRPVDPSVAIRVEVVRESNEVVCHVIWAERGEQIVSMELNDRLAGAADNYRNRE